jgi:outer membrane murein-binding lipoprotein Lpp
MKDFKTLLCDFCSVFTSLSDLSFAFFAVSFACCFCCISFSAEKLQKITATVDTENKNLNQVNEKIKQKQIEGQQAKQEQGLTHQAHVILLGYIFEKCHSYNQQYHPI